MAHHYHLRLTPSALKTPITDLSGWLCRDSLWVIAAEKGTKTQKPHLHFYIESDDSLATIRNRVRAAYSLTVGQKGKASAEYCLKGDCYKDPSPAYVVKEGTIVDYRGISYEQLDRYVTQGNAKWGSGRFQDILDALEMIPESSGDSVEVAELRVSTTPAAPRSEWDQLFKAFQEDSRKLERKMCDIQRWIKSYYLVRSRPIPRAGDLRRYSYSLWAIVNDKVEEGKICEADLHERVYMSEPREFL